MSTSNLAVGVLAILFALPALSQPTAPAPTVAPAVVPDVPDIAFEKYTLPNGLEVILSQDRRLPMVAVNLWYHVGPANEDAGRTGFAHLFEHMMFQSSKHVPSDAHFKLLEGAGASDINGTTDFDRTNYFETLPSNQLELALWLEADRMGYLPDVLDQAALSNQQDVVRNERRQSVENQPYGVVQERLFHLLFPKGHPYYASVIGSHEDIQAAKLADVQKFFKTFYAPNNASLAIVGDFETAEVKRLVAKYFSSLKSGPPVPKLDVRTPPITAERRAVVPDRVELERVYMGWITAPVYTPGDAEADLAAHVLGGGKSSRLYKKLVYDLQIAQDVTAYQYGLTLGSVFGIEATARQGHTAAELEQVISAELEKFRREGPSAQELERARNAIETQVIGGLETLGGFGGVADRLNAYNHYLGEPGYLARDIARYRTATPDSVRKFADAQLATNSRVVVHGVPGKPELGPEVPTPPATSVAAGKGAETVNVAESWREKPPAPAAARAFEPPVPQTFKLANGLTVILNERRNLPVVNAALVFRTGSDANPAAQPGLANFTVAMLDEGTQTRSSLQLADDVAQLGAKLATSSAMDNSNVVLGVLKRNVPAAMKLLADVVLNPTFPAAEVERLRGQRLSQLIEERQEPGAVAAKAMAAALYGPHHPYGYSELGTEAATKALSRDDMLAFWKANFVPNNAALVVAGAISATELKALAEENFGKWQSGQPRAAVLGTPTTTQAQGVLVDMPGAAQTNLRIAKVAVPRSTPDYAPLEVMNAALGGLFSSRINLNLREEHGYTYGAGSLFRYRRGNGPFIIYTSVRSDVTGAAVKEIFKEVERMVAAPLTADELALSKDWLVRSLPGQFETSSQAIGSFADTFVYDLGFDYFAKLPQRINAVDAAAVQDVAKRHLVPGRMVTVAVGDRAQIESQLRDEAGVKTIERRDADGKLQ